MNNRRHKIAYRMTALSLWIDAILRAYWPLLFILLLAVTLALTGITAHIPKSLFQFLTLALIITAIMRGKNRFIRPASGDIERRLTRFNRFAVNPYRVLRDRPAENLTLKQETLWQNARKQAIDNIHKSLPAPPRLTAIKPGASISLGLILCALILAGHSARSSAGDLLKTAFVPDLPAFLEIEPRVVELWLTPPEYTGLAPIYLTEATEDIIQLPEGSTVTARISKGWMTPRLAMGDEIVPFEKSTARGYTVTVDIPPEAPNVRILSGLIRRLAVDITLFSDKTPIVSVVEGPGVSENNLVKLRYAARDDFGIEKIDFIMRPDVMIAARLGLPDAWVQSYETGGQPFIDRTLSLNLQDHPWSGLPVEIEMKATDSKGQETVSAVYNFILPERFFEHPLARQLAEIRKELFLSGGADSFNLFAGRLFNLREQTGIYKNQTDIYLGLSSAMYRLMYLRTSDTPALESVRTLLWELALRIEGGSSSIAAENLENTVADVLQALQNPNISEEEFARLQSKLEQAVSEYMQSLMNELAAQMQEQGMNTLLPGEIADLVQNQINAGDFMKDLQDVLKNGSREEIANALETMRETMQNLKNLQFKPMTAEMQRVLQEMAKLKELIRDQETLLDETLGLLPPQTASDTTLEAASPPLPEKDSIFTDTDIPLHQPDAAADMRTYDESFETDTDIQAGVQLDLKQELSDIQAATEQATGMSASFMTRASKAMESAHGALARHRPGQSIPHQERAIRELKQGMEQTMQHMASKIGQVLSFGISPGNSSQGPRGETGLRDPLGRPMQSGPGQEDDVDISIDQERRRIREIRNRILDHADDVEDNTTGQDYYNRLLERF